MTRSLAKSDAAKADRLDDAPTGGESPDSDECRCPERRPYTAPRLRFLGSVRQLTLGSGGFCSDGPNGAPVPDICE
jgi:hypothetical protein